MRFKVSLKNTLNLTKNDLNDIVTESVARTLGETLTTQMKEMIAKGISPIRGSGRFPAYKGVAAARSKEKILKRAAGDSRKDRAAAKELADADKRKAYPYSVQGKYPDKKERPVNLNLTGQQMASLTYSVNSKRQGGYEVEIGYFNQEATIKEQGHREGANGQPLRPTIPIENEKLATTLTKVIEDTFQGALQGWIKRMLK